MLFPRRLHRQTMTMFSTKNVCCFSARIQYKRHNVRFAKIVIQMYSVFKEGKKVKFAITGFDACTSWMRSESRIVKVYYVRYHKGDIKVHTCLQNIK